MTFHDMPAIHYGFMAIFILLSMILLSALVWYYFGPAKRPAFILGDILSDQKPSLRISAVTPVLNKAFIVVADISGYTKFLKGSRFSSDHAQYLVLQLLDAISEEAGSSLNFIKVEGDAIMFACDGADTRSAGLTLNQTISKMVMAFYGRRKVLGIKNTCLCSACRNIDMLDLKIAVDLGSISSFSINEKPDISGMPIIRAFRLLKVETRHKANIIVTKTASKYVNLPWRQDSKVLNYQLEDIGPVGVQYYGFEPEQLTEREMIFPDKNPGFWSVFYGKFQNNIGHIIKSISQRIGS